MRRSLLVLVTVLPACFGSRTVELPPPTAPLPLCIGDVSFEGVDEPSTPPPPISGGTLAVMSTGDLVAADPDRDLVYVVDTTERVTTLPLEAGSEPGRVVEGPTGRAFVALRRSSQVVEVDVAGAKQVRSLTACALPRGLAWSRERSTLYVACAGGELTELRFSDATNVTRASTSVAPDLRDVVVTPAGVVASTFRSAQLFEVSTTGAVRALPAFGDVVEQTPRVAWRMTVARGHLVTSHQLASRAQLGVAGCTDNPDGSERVSAFGRNGGGYGGGTGPGAVASVISEVQVDGRPVTEGAPTMFVSGALPVDVAVSASGHRTAVVLAGSRSVAISDESLGGLAQREGVGEPTAVAFRGEVPVVFSREPAMLVVGDKGSEHTVSLSSISRRSSSHRRFHEATRAGLACASCHPEAGDDGFTWDIGGTHLRTPSLRGGLSGTEPFHWEGDQKDLGALMNDVFRKRMLGPALSTAQSQALMHWLDAQPKLAPPAVDVAAVERGRALFESAQTACATCHSGQHGTNNQTLDVGTGGLFQVPRLDELAYRWPYLHDGRAVRLEDRFGPAGGGQLHGFTAHLEAAELADLVAYLKSR